MMTYKNRVLAIATTAITIAMTSFGATTFADEQAKTSQSPALHGGILNVGVFSDFVTLDPLMSSALIDEELYNNLFDPLLTLSPSGQIEPNLITHWTISSNGKVYTFALRRGVQFQDGTPFNAQAIMYNWNWILNPKNASPRSSNLQLVQSMTAPNPYTFIVKLKAPFAPFLAVLTARTGEISSPTAMKKWGTQYDLHPTGTGAFEFVNWIRNDELTIRRNPHYWNKGLPYLNEVIFHPIVSQVQKLNALKSGQVNLIDSVPYQSISSLSSMPTIRHGNIMSYGFSDLILNDATSPFKNVHDRLAVDYAIDRQTINKIVYFGFATPSYSQFSPASWAYDPQLSVPFSDALAKQQLRDAGNPKGFTFTIDSGNDPQSIQETEMMQSQLAQVGIKVTLRPLDDNTLISDAISHQFQGSLLGWSGMLDPDSNSYAFDTKNGPFNSAQFNNPQVAALLQKARETENMSQRKTLYWESAKIIDQQAGYIFLEYPHVIDAWTSNVHGFTEYPDQLLRLTNVWMSK